MRFNVYIRRIFQDKVKVFFVIVLMVIPLLDIGQILYDLYQIPEDPVPDPRYVAFSALYTVGNNHLLYRIMFWFLPIYLLIITGEDSLEDHDTGYRNILISRVGKKQYIWGKARNSFCFSFLLILFSLGLNYGLLHLIFEKGGDVWIWKELYPVEENRMYTIGYYYPTLVNIVNILMTATYSGLIGLIGNSLAMNFHDRKTVYGITFMLWFVFVIVDDGLMSILHPFSNMVLDRFLWGFFLLAAGYLIIAVTAIITEVKSDEI